MENRDASALGVADLGAMIGEQAASRQSQAALDYARVAEAIRYLRAEAPRQPSLAEVAAVVHLSPEHFQRQFTVWAGLSPKQFARTLTVEHAKRLLGEAQPPSLFDLADTLQLSSPSRLHDAFVRIEAMSPGEYGRGAEGLDLHWAFAKTRFGNALIASSLRGICSLGFHDDLAAGLQVLRKRYSKANLHEAVPDAQQMAALALVDGAAADPTKPLSLHLRGTTFQHQVWAALLSIAPGRATTYGALGRSIGFNSGFQAIGGAVGANPVAWLIPCHRVLRSDGDVSGYAWGVERKCAMLGLESPAFSAADEQ